MQNLPLPHRVLEHREEIPSPRRGDAIAATIPTVPNSKRFVYVLRSGNDPTRYYTGLTSDVARRLETHNSGGSMHTIANRPWQLVVAVEFSSEDSAARFERYLKSGSGRAFAKRHFV